MFRRKLQNRLNTIGGLGAAAPKLSCRGAPPRLALREWSYAPHTLKGGQSTGARSAPNYFSAKPKIPPVVFFARRRTRRRAAPLRLRSGAIFLQPAFADIADKVRHRQQQKKTFALPRRRRDFWNGKMLGKMTHKRPYTQGASGSVGACQTSGACAVVSGAAAGLLWGIQGRSPCRPFLLPLPPRLLRIATGRHRRPHTFAHTTAQPPRIVAPHSRRMIPANHKSAPHWRQPHHAAEGGPLRAGALSPEHRRGTSPSATLKPET